MSPSQQVENRKLCRGMRFPAPPVHAIRRSVTETRALYAAFLISHPARQFTYYISVLPHYSDKNLILISELQNMKFFAHLIYKSFTFFYDIVTFSWHRFWKWYGQDYRFDLLKFKPHFFFSFPLFEVKKIIKRVYIMLQYWIKKTV